MVEVGGETVVILGVGDAGKVVLLGPIVTSAVR